MNLESFLTCRSCRNVATNKIFHAEANQTSYTMSYYRGKERNVQPLVQETFAPLRSNKKFIFNWKFVVTITFAWLTFIQYFERILVHRTINKCIWDNWEDWNEDSKPHRIALIADPQIVDEYSYLGIQGFLTHFIEILTDNYARRNYEYLQGVLDPDSTIFLGDLFDGGREWEDDQWFKEYKRFNTIFKPRVNRRFINSIPGNHDIGYEKIEYEKLRRFSAFFGELNSFIELGNHSIISLDSISLSHPDPKINQEAKNFLDSLNEKLNPDFPRILLLHVPFYRFTDKQTCGPLRESKGMFPIQKGKQYQTVLEYDMSQTILTKIHPEIAFAGDDHDYCDINQSYNLNGGFKTTREITVKSFAMNGGINKPAMQLLSLYNPGNGKDTFQTEMCFMPLPYRPLKFYFVILLISVVYLTMKFLYPLEGHRALHRILNFIPNLLLEKADVELPRWKLKSAQHGEKRWPEFGIHILVAFSVPIFLLRLYFKNV